MSRDTKYSSLFNQLLEVDGPFLTVDVARRVFGKILEIADQDKVDDLRVAISEWEAEPAEFNSRWIRWVLTRLLDFEDEILLEGPAIAHISHLVPQHGVTLRPTLVVDDPMVDGVKPRVLVIEWPHETNLHTPVKGTDRWTTASPVARAEELCRATKIPLALVTSGEEWVLVHANVDEPTSTAVWQSLLWLEERDTLDMFVALCGAKSFFGRSDEDTIEQIFVESADSEEEVTTTLGRQVKAAVELLVNAFSEADRERHGELLVHTSEEQVYRAAVTVMMRLVFLLSAEERGLLALGDDLYDRQYAASTLWDELDDRSAEEDQLFTRYDAWPRLLATFRMVHGGIDHDRFAIPPYGGQLFDPDRFPFLEGREPDEPFMVGEGDDRLTKAINNKVVKEILRSLQWLSLDRFAEVRRVSFSNLDVEQIGTVYEGLLDYTTVQVSDVTLGLLAKKSRKGNEEPEVALSVLEEERAKGRASFEQYLKDELKFSATELRKLDQDLEDIDRSRLRSACANDEDLMDRVAPFFDVLRTDLRDLPLVFLPDSYVVTKSTERATTGAHYTPRSIAEMIVKHTIEPLVYDPGPQNEEDQAKWQLRPWEEIVDLKIVDPACGSGAMLVATCRFMAARLVEAWQEQGAAREVGLQLPGAGGAPLILPADDDDLMIEAMRVVAERCLYGVDINEMAVEMCKLSLWLGTMARGKAFSFLDHAIRHGDSLLGVTSVGEIKRLELGDIESEQSLGWSAGLERRLDRSLALRSDLLAVPTQTTFDAEAKARFLARAQSESRDAEIVADGLVGAHISTAGRTIDDRQTRLVALAGEVGDEQADLGEARARFAFWLDQGRPERAQRRVPLHWPLAFPEIFLSGRRGFDAVVSNPPFLGGVKIAASLGDNYGDYLKQQWREAKGFVDLCAFFTRRMAQVVHKGGIVGQLAPQNMTASTNRKASLDYLVSCGLAVVWGQSAFKWPGSAGSLYVCAFGIAGPSSFSIRRLDGHNVDFISTGIDSTIDLTGVTPVGAERWINYSQGVDLYGKSFLRESRDWVDELAREPRLGNYLREYVNAQSFCEQPDHRSGKLVVDFGERELHDLREVQEIASEIASSVAIDRANQTKQIHEHRPWLHWDKRTSAYKKAREDSAVVLACPNVSKHLPFAFVSSEFLLSKTMKFFPGATMAEFGILQSSFFRHWAYATSRRRGSGVEFSTRASLETFPVVAIRRGDDVAAVANEISKVRRNFMAELQIGLTEMMNRYHNPADESDQLVRLRGLQPVLDRLVAPSLGLDELSIDDVSYDFRQDADDCRFGLAEVEVDRMLSLMVAQNKSLASVGVKPHLSGIAQPPSDEPSLF